MRLEVIKVVFGQQGLVCVFPTKQVSLTAPIYKADEPLPTVQREDRLTAPCSTFAPHVLFSVPALCRLRASLRMPSKTPDKVPRYHLDLTSASCPHAYCFCHNVPLQSSEHIGHVPNSLCASSHGHGTLRLPAPSDSLQDLLQGLP